MKLKIKKLHEAAIVPQQAHEGDVGLDLSTIETKWILPFQRKLFKTGISAQPEPGHELQLRPRSGNALKRGLTILNSPATIEPTYRGDIGVILFNASPFPVKIKAGERIAQIVAKPYIEKVDVEVVEELDESVRGDKGFGSSGVEALPQVRVVMPTVEVVDTNVVISEWHYATARAIVDASPHKHSPRVRADMINAMAEKIAREDETKTTEIAEEFWDSEPKPAPRPKTKRQRKKQAKKRGESL